jgi:hypothetical protein
MFSPRGGSAPAARALARGLRDRGCAVTLVAGSRSDLGPHGEADAFYGAVHAVRFDAALASPAPVRFEGPAGSAPLHPSFEDRPGAPDLVFAKLVTSTTSDRCEPGAASSSSLTPVDLMCCTCTT